METRVCKSRLATLLLQRHPEHKRRWVPVASWGRCLEVLELEESRVLLELKALREGAWKLSEFTAFAKNLVFNISHSLKALLKVANRAHPAI